MLERTGPSPSPRTLGIQATASDADGEIVSYSWSKIRGGAADLIGINSAELIAKNLTAGIYEFKLTVEDNDGAVKSDSVIITVKEIENIPPVANAGPDKTLQLPENSLYLKGSATDKDGSIVSWKWTQISGETVSIASSTAATASVTNLKTGTYVFRLTVTDDKGATGANHMRIDVLEKAVEIAESTSFVIRHSTLIRH